MADEKEALTESQKQTGAGNALETRRLRKMAAEQQQERRAWLFDNNLSEEEREQIVSALQGISKEYDDVFDEFLERETDVTQALGDAIGKYGYHQVLAALESGEVSAAYSGAIRRDLAEIVVEDFEDTHGWELDPIDEMEGESESAAEALVNLYGGYFDGHGNYIPQAGADC